MQTPSPVRSTDAVELRLARSAVGFLIVLGGPVIGVAALFAGVPGALSAGVGALVVIGMFLMAGALMSWAARISPTALMAAVLGGYLLRLFIYAALILLLRPVEWLHPPSLAIGTAVLLVAVLAWEVRVASRNPSMFWVDAGAGRAPGATVVESRDSTAPGASPEMTESLTSPVERTLP